MSSMETSINMAKELRETISGDFAPMLVCEGDTENAIFVLFIDKDDWPEAIAASVKRTRPHHIDLITDSWITLSDRPRQDAVVIVRVGMGVSEMVSLLYRMEGDKVIWEDTLDTTTEPDSGIGGPVHDALMRAMEEADS